MTSPEPRDSPERLGSPDSNISPGEIGEQVEISVIIIIITIIIIIGEQVEISVAKERKTSGGFFAKRFGITKMKDHSTKKDRLIDTNSSNNSPMEFKPLKVSIVMFCTNITIITIVTALPNDPHLRCPLSSGC